MTSYFLEALFTTQNAATIAFAAFFAFIGLLGYSIRQKERHASKVVRTQFLAGEEIDWQTKEISSIQNRKTLLLFTVAVFVSVPIWLGVFSWVFVSAELLFVSMLSMSLYQKYLDHIQAKISSQSKLPRRYRVIQGILAGLMLCGFFAMLGSVLYSEMHKTSYTSVLAK